VSLRVVFMGSPDFAVPVLKAIHANFQLTGVITQPDKPSGRGLRNRPTAVKAAALKIDVPVLAPKDVLSTESLSFMRACYPQVIVVAAFGKILPDRILQLPPLGCINLHASLLPRHRGASPISSAILAGDAVTGVCTIIMDRGMDTGAILLTKEIPIRDDDTAGSLHDRMLEPGAELVVETLRLAAAGRLHAEAQNHEEATYTKPLLKQDARIEWNRGAAYCSRHVRAMNPWPVAFSRLSGDEIKIWEAVPAEGEGTPGTVVKTDRAGISVGAGDGLLILKQVQAPGKKRMAAADFARGRHLKEGDRFE
jgi:methionyl-tRNA formyltransferase